MVWHLNYHTRFSWGEGLCVLASPVAPYIAIFSILANLALSLAKHYPLAF